VPRAKRKKDNLTKGHARNIQSSRKKVERETVGIGERSAGRTRVDGPFVVGPTDGEGLETQKKGETKALTMGTDITGRTKENPGGRAKKKKTGGKTKGRG